MWSINHSAYSPHCRARIRIAPRRQRRSGNIVEPCFAIVDTHMYSLFPNVPFLSRCLRRRVMMRRQVTRQKITQATSPPCRRKRWRSGNIVEPCFAIVDTHMYITLSKCAISLQVLKKKGNDEETSDEEEDQTSDEPPKVWHWSILSLSIWCGLLIITAYSPRYRISPRRHGLMGKVCQWIIMRWQSFKMVIRRSTMQSRLDERYAVVFFFFWYNLCYISSYTGFLHFIIFKKKAATKVWHCIIAHSLFYITVLFLRWLSTFGNTISKKTAATVCYFVTLPKKLISPSHFYRNQLIHTLIFTIHKHMAGRGGFRRRRFFCWIILCRCTSQAEEVAK